MVLSEHVRINAKAKRVFTSWLGLSECFIVIDNVYAQMYS